jgi:hypothetical protein
MSQAPGFDFSKFVPGFDFLQKLSGASPGAAAPSVSSWVAPTLDPKELERRIQDLKTVQFWLEQNSQAVSATIQALEVQRMTLATLQGMNVSMNELADALKVKPTVAEAPQDTPKTASKPKARTSSKSERQAAAANSSTKTPAQAPASGIDPMAWWGSLTQQFQQIAGDAMKDMQRKADAVAATAPASPPSKSTRKRSSPKK